MTPEKSAEMARPITDPKAKLAADAKVKPAKPGPQPSAPPAAEPNVQPGDQPVDDQVTTTEVDANGAETKLSAATATISREASGIAGGDAQSATTFSRNQGQTVEVRGPDGVTRKVRIVGPTF